MAAYEDDWKPYQWYCPNCGTLVTGCKNSSGTIKGICGHCKACMVRIQKNPGEEVIKIRAAGQ